MAIIKKESGKLVSIDTNDKTLAIEEIPGVRVSHLGQPAEPNKVYEYQYSPKLDIRYSDDELSDFINKKVDLVLNDNVVVDIVLQA